MSVLYDLNDRCQRTCQGKPVYTVTLVAGSLPHAPKWSCSVVLPDGTTHAVQDVAGSQKDAKAAVARVALASWSPVAAPSAMFRVDVPTENHHLVIAKALDVIRHALVRPLCAELSACHGTHWLDKVKNGVASPTVRQRIDDKMLQWDAMAVLTVAVWHLRQLHPVAAADQLRALPKLTKAMRHRTAHLSANTAAQLSDWAVCKALIDEAARFLEWWNACGLFGVPVDHGFVRQLRDIAEAGPLYLNAPPAIDRSDVQLAAQLGSGAHGAVHAATHRGNEIAVKRFRTAAPPAQLVNITRELQATHWLNHPNIIRLIGVCKPTAGVDEWWLLMDRCASSLHDALCLERQAIGIGMRLRWAREVAAALRYCHAQSPAVLHLDLKSHNILLSGSRDGRTALVADFGTARIVAGDTLQMSSLHTTELWTAPELLRDSTASKKADVYSFGVLLWELLVATGELPFSHLRLTPVMTVQAIVAGTASLAPVADAPAEAAQLVLQCTAHQRDSRPSFDVVLADIERMATVEVVFEVHEPSDALCRLATIDFQYGAHADDVIAAHARIEMRGSSRLVLLSRRRFFSLADSLSNNAVFQEAVAPDLESDSSLPFQVCAIAPLSKYAFLSKSK
jgi:serine/threonine protein kinase